MEPVNKHNIENFFSVFVEEGIRGHGKRFAAQGIARDPKVWVDGKFGGGLYRIERIPRFDADFQITPVAKALYKVVYHLWPVEHPFNPPRAFSLPAPLRPLARARRTERHPNHRLPTWRRLPLPHAHTMPRL